jgi:cell division FtsZ-interacting protein ZapD
MLKNLLAAAGLGQSDLVNVFEQTLQRLDKSELQTPERRVGQAQAIEAMVSVLRDEDVMNGGTMKQILDGLNLWVNKAPRRRRS